MKPVISVFFDGLKPESIQYMPFLNSLPSKKRLETILGYSVTCHASMYTGVYPDKHGLWFLWKVAPESSPFRWLKKIPLLFLANNIPGWIAVHKISSLKSKLTAYWGIPRLFNLPLKYWSAIDVAEKRYWDEDGYLENCKTIFEWLREYKIDYEVVGMVPHVIDTSRLVNEHQFSDIKPWIYLFIGDVDALSHHFTQNSSEVITKLRQFDSIVERCCREIQQKCGEYDLIVWSDHGHVPLKEKIDLYSIFKSAGDDLTKYLHIVDINVARFWFDSEKDRTRVETILEKIPNGFILSDDVMANEHVLMKDHRYGELIFYLDAGSAFSKTIFGFGLRQKSIHGYLPHHIDCDGVFLTNHQISPEIEKVRLVDILPSLLNLFDLPIPPDTDGKVIWS